MSDEQEQTPQSPTLHEQAIATLGRAWRDIADWVRLAKWQRERIENADHCPHAPTTGAIAAS